ncbi:MAG TPA: DUF4412 domain-containing protein [Blastocatellia bacterium]
MLNTFNSPSKRSGAAIVPLFAVCAVMIVTGACNKSGAGIGPGSSTSSGNFEGTISMNMTGPTSQSMSVLYYIKGQRVRMETTISGHATPDSVTLWDSAAGKFTSLMPSEKEYMTSDFAAMRERAKNLPPEARQTPKLTDTGKQETIAGYPCHDWLIEDRQQTEVCLAKGLGDLSTAGNGGPAGFLGRMFKGGADHPTDPNWAKMIEGGAFPLKTTATRDGQTSFSLEATSIDRKKVDDSLFTVPSDYKEVKAPSIPGAGNPSN